jgi:hypothetical protein
MPDPSAAEKVETYDKDDVDCNHKTTEDWMVSPSFLRLQIAYRYFHWEDGSQYVLRLKSNVTYTAMISPAGMKAHRRGLTGLEPGSTDWPFLFLCFGRCAVGKPKDTVCHRIDC